MSTSTVAPVQAVAGAPRGARWPADLAAFLWRQAELLAESRRRAAALRASERRLIEAAAARRHAWRLERHDPRTAADLLAAADRHELQGGA
jgi:hypothetical protein